MMDGHTRFSGLRRFLADLTPSQKLAALTITAVMIASAWWVNTSRPLAAAGGGMEPVLDQAFAAAELAMIAERLQSQDIPFEIRDARIYAPAARQIEVLSDLYYADVLRGGTEDGFDALIKRMSPWDPPSKTDQLFNHLRQQTARRVIAELDGVRKATVTIDPTNERRLNGASIYPSAMVDIQTRDAGAAAGAGSAGGGGAAINRRQLANAAVNVLVGSLAGLSRERVMVTIDGASYTTGATDGFAEASEVLERRQQCEQAYVAKVRQLLGYIPDLLVSVSVDLNVQSLVEEKRTIDPDEYAYRDGRGGRRTRQDAALLPGLDAVVANAVPMIPPDALRASAAAAATTGAGEHGDGGEEFGEHPRYTQVASETSSKVRTPAGKETVRSASVAVPRSYFVGIYQRASTNRSIEPDDALLQPVIDLHAMKIRSLVKNALGLENDAAVTVEAYDDGFSAATVVAVPREQATMAAAAGASALPTPALLLNTHAREIALVTLGIVAMLMLSMVLRRGQAAQLAPAMAPMAAMAPIRPASPAVQERHGLLDGVIDEEVEIAPPPHGHPQDRSASASSPHAAQEQEAHQLFRRVRDMVSEHPDDAARVLRNWIYENR